MKDIFYKPDLSPERDYMSDDDFSDVKEPSDEDLDGDEETSDSSNSIDDEIDKIKEIIKQITTIKDILPEEIKETIVDNLEKINEDLDEMTKLPTPNIPDIEDEPADSVPPVSDKENIVPPPLPNIPFLKLPPGDGIDIELTKKPNLGEVMLDSFKKDKVDMYKDFVKRLKLGIQQYMRELLYIAKDGGFDSYLDLFTRYKLKTNQKIPANLMHASDRIVRNQVSRDQKTRLFKKTYNIDQTIFHMLANKASYELRNRYYAIPYNKSKGYVDLQENDELRKMRRDYDKKYDENMYNYYKYLNSSVMLTDEILKTFLSEARGKSTLKKNGVDVEAGINEEKEKQEKVAKELIDKTNKAIKEAEENDKKNIDKYSKAGKSASYSGSYGDKKGAVIS